MTGGRYSRIVVLLLVVACLAEGQTERQPMFSHPLVYTAARGIHGTPPCTASSVPDTLRILAAMISFQDDNDSRTSGTGSFDLSSTTAKVIDAPPRNRMYFQNHMSFVENYYRKVSDGKLIVKGDVLDSIYRIAHQMQYYSPPHSSTNNIELGRLMEDAWHTVDSVTPGIPFHLYNAFVIFHAGVGRDIDLVTLYGFDPTPFDLPSIYLNLCSLQKMFGSSYPGLPVSDGSFITNSMILPETENRELQSIGGPVLLELGINGLFAASIGSHLGLPDLFDTKTGRSGIGRFGLMDGQSIFSWNGVFPPEPSAWEKYHLKWVTPITITTGDTLHDLPAVSLANSDTIYRVLISAKEYFLVENRNRDANRDGTTVTMVKDGVTHTFSRERDTTGFNAFNQDSLFGVITDVDEFDWSLPGGVSSRTHELFDGGILIWHIDENVIDANYASDAVNADPDRRGVNLMEADGSQDIGQSYPFLSAGSGSEDGTVLDFWYDGNNAPLRRQANEFTPTSHPSSLSNDRANSHVYIKEFSKRGPRMNARIKVGDAEVAILTGFPKTIGGRVQNRSIRLARPFQAGTDAIIVGTSKYTYGWTPNGNPILPSFSSKGILTRAPSIGNGTIDYVGNIVAADFNQDQVLDFGILENGFSTLSPPFQSLLTYSMSDINVDSIPDLLFTRDLGSWALTSLVISDSLIAYGAGHGFVYLLRHDGTIADSVQPFPSDTSNIVGLSIIQQPSSFLAVSENGSVGMTNPIACIVQQSSLTVNLARPLTSSGVTGTILPNNGRGTILVSKDGFVYLVSPCFESQPGFPVATNGEVLTSPAIADIDGDGQKDIIVFSGNKIYAINAVGSILDNFPITTPTSKTILTSPIVADLDGNGTPDIAAVTQEGLVVAYDRTGKLVRGFPLQAGINGGSTPAAFAIQTSCLSCPIGIGLAVASDDGHVYAWQTGSVSSMSGAGLLFPWPQYMHDAQNTGLDESTLTPTPVTRDFLPSSRAYNWPNPVGAQDGFKTHIRYYVASDAKVTIKVFDMAGDLVTDFGGKEFAAVGGLDNEVDWDVTDIQSGVYFAHIDARGTASSGNAVIKIAIVK